MLPITSSWARNTFRSFFPDSIMPTIGITAHGLSMEQSLAPPCTLPVVLRSPNLLALEVPRDPPKVFITPCTRERFVYVESLRVRCPREESYYAGT